MKLKDQVVSVELAKRLKGFGIKQRSCFYYFKEQAMNQFELSDSRYHNSEIYSAFTVAELGEMLPVGFHSGKSGVGKPWICKARRKVGVFSVGDTEAEARAKMLIHLIEKGIVKP